MGLKSMLGASIAIQKGIELFNAGKSKDEICLALLGYGEDKLISTYQSDWPPVTNTEIAIITFINKLFSIEENCAHSRFLELLEQALYNNSKELQYMQNMDLREKVQRRKAVDEALASLILEGLYITHGCMELAEQYVKGEIATAEELTRLIREKTIDELERP